jgi:hypothetical protein
LTSVLGRGREGGGGVNIFFLILIVSFIVVNPFKILEPYDNPSGRTVHCGGGGWVVVVVCKPILLFSLGFDQAEQNNLSCFRQGNYSNMIRLFLKKSLQKVS